MVILKGVSSTLALFRRWRVEVLAAIPAFVVTCAFGLPQEPNPTPPSRSSAALDANVPVKPSATPAERAMIRYGREIAVAQCSSCHAIDNEAKSPNPDAPPLRNALWRYQEENLATHFIEALRVGHGDMPVFDFTPVGADALVAYLKAIKTSQDIDEK